MHPDLQFRDIVGSISTEPFILKEHLDHHRSCHRVVVSFWLVAAFQEILVTNGTRNWNSIFLLLLFSRTAKYRAAASFSPVDMFHKYLTFRLIFLLPPPVRFRWPPVNFSVAEIWIGFTRMCVLVQGRQEKVFASPASLARLNSGVERSQTLVGGGCNTVHQQLTQGDTKITGHAF